MYHLGKVLKVFKPSEDDSKSADNGVQVHLQMWDENEIIVAVHAALNSEIREKEFVFVRYTQPEPLVVKILSQKEGKKLWETFAEVLDRKKRVNIPVAFKDNPQSRMIG